MIKTLFAVLAVAVCALLIYAETRPDHFSISRSASIQAPPEKILPLIADLRRFNTWNPFAKKDPAIEISYRGTPTGPGSAYDFKGGKSGAGSLQINEVQPPSRVTMTLDMSAPMSAHNDIEFKLEPQGGATTVTWTMQGDSPYIAKLMGVFISVDKMVGGDFEAGLSSLKAEAERG